MVGSALAQESPSPIRQETFKSASGAITMHIVVFDRSRYSLRVIDNGNRPAQPKFANLADAMQRRGCLAGINGGFFDMQHFTPTGMMVADGDVLSAFDPKGWQEGVLVVRGDEVSLLDRDAFDTPGDITAALQSSPWLVRAGQVEERQKADARRARRVFVGMGKRNVCAIGFSTPATFYELAELLVSEPVSEVADFTEVLALDGATSAGFWSDIDGKQVSNPEQVAVRNFVGVVPVGTSLPAPKRFGAVGICIALLLIAAGAFFEFRKRRLRAAEPDIH